MVYGRFVTERNRSRLASDNKSFRSRSKLLKAFPNSLPQYEH